MMWGTAASVSTLLIVVGMPNRPGGGRERRLDSGIAALALDGVHQRGLFAADVGPGAAVHDHLDPLAGAEDVCAQRTGRVRLVHGAWRIEVGSVYSPRMKM